MRITPSTSPKDGSSFPSSLISPTLAGSSVKILFPINPPQIIPETSIQINAVGIPTMIMVPRFTPSAFATSTDPADGGTKRNHWQDLTEGGLHSTELIFLSASQH